MLAEARPSEAVGSSGSAQVSAGDTVERAEELPPRALDFTMRAEAGEGS